MDTELWGARFALFGEGGDADMIDDHPPELGHRSWLSLKKAVLLWHNIHLLSFSYLCVLVSLLHYWQCLTRHVTNACLVISHQLKTRLQGAESTSQSDGPSQTSHSGWTFQML